METIKKRRSNITVAAYQKRVDKAIDRYMQRLDSLYILDKSLLPDDDDLSPLHGGHRQYPFVMNALNFWQRLESLSGNDTYRKPVFKITEYASDWEKKFFFLKRGGWQGRSFLFDRNGNAVNALRKLEVAIDKAIEALQDVN